MNSAAPTPKVTKSQVIPLAEAGVSEVELENIIVEELAVLGLGDVILIERQRRQERAGRLDLLLEDREGESRFEVELKIGSLDESHLVRAIEYWDIERRHYPGYVHCAVIIAEDVTSRFLNVIQLFSGSVPIIAIQVNCNKVGDLLALSFVKLIDSRTLRRDDRLDVKAEATDRNSWLAYVGQNILAIADECLVTINSAAKRKRSLKFNKQFIGLTDSGKPDNFVYFEPRKSLMRVRANLAPVEPWVKRIQESALDFKVGSDEIFIDITPQNFTDSRGLIDEVLVEAVRQDEV
ncbi:MAG: hypothetical protein ABI833_15175 [Acidobacteriota bacterium]